MKSNKILLFFFIILSPYSSNFAQIKEFSHPNILSFENGVLPATKGENSTLTVSQKHFKHGKQSLLWEWNDENASWSIKENIPYQSLNPFGDNSVATFVFWVYNPQKSANGRLKFSFYKENKLCSWFYYNLNFKGWSGAWVAFDRDMEGVAEENMDELRISVEGEKNGKLYFDHLMLSSFQDVRHHTADFQAPFINKETTSHWLVLLQSWNKKFDVSSEKLQLTEAIEKDIKTIENRLTENILEKTKPSSIKQLRKRYVAYQIKLNPDSTIVGIPLFFERYGEAYERLGAPRYSVVFGNEMGVAKLNKLMFDLAVTYQKIENLSEKNEIGAMYSNLMEYMLDQGFFAGSAMGTLHHLGYSMRLYYPAAFLMKEKLKIDGLSNDVQQAMEWFSGTGEVKEKPLQLGMDVDAFNTTLVGRLASILMLENSLYKLQYLSAFKRWVDNGFEISDGTLGTFKIDGTMFHHRHNYPAYAVGGLEGAVNSVWLFHNTSFALNIKSKETLKNALLSMRFYCNLTNWPLSLSGRHPDGLGKLIPSHFAKLALSGSADETEKIDRELATAYLRLIGDSVTKEATVFKKYGISVEKSPNGNRSFPYSSLSIHRRDNWMVSAMGHSRYLWATESYVGANHYGRYLNHGNLQILATGNPITNFSSGFKQEGWDWNHFAGTTAAELPIENLRADIKNLDEESGYEEMLLSDEAFAGGISIENKNGMYAMKLHEHDKYNGSLRARKSFFFFNNRIIALGSNIQSNLENNEVHTTLFQVYQPSEIKPITLNQRKITKFPFTQTIDKKNTVLSDGLNNYFFVKNNEVVLKRTIQHSFHEETDEPTQNPFSLSYINHGAKATKDNYEYMILVQPDEKELKQQEKIFKNNNADYQVLQKDSMAHIVYDSPTKTFGFVFFKAGKFQSKELFVAVNLPSLVMIEEKNETKSLLSVADPDLRFYEGESDEVFDEKGKRIERSIYSRTWINNPSKQSKVELTLKGKWKLSEQSDFVKVKNSIGENTIFEIECQHGLTREALIEKF